jgi:hypothetical protein
MKKLIKNEKKQPEQKTSEYMKALIQSKTINNFETNFRFTKDCGLELLKGTQTGEHIEVLHKSIEGLEDFIDLLKEKIKETETK